MEKTVLVREGRVEELYWTLKELISNNQLRRKISLNSRVVLRKYFNVYTMVKGFLRAIEYVMFDKKRVIYNGIKEDHYV